MRCTRRPANLWASALVWAALAWALLAGGPAPTRVRGQEVDLANRPIADLRIEGLKQVSRQLVLNQVRQKKGNPYNAHEVEQDIVRITHLGRFSSVVAKVQPQPDGSLVLTYALVEQPALADVQVVGNKAVSDQELLKLILLRSGDPIDPFLIDRARHEIEKRYQKDGFDRVSVTADDELLRESNILLFHVREGPLVIIRAIRFQGNRAIDEGELYSQIKSRTGLWVFRKGELNEDTLLSDAAKIREHYQDQGYLDAQVARKRDPSEDSTEATVTFVIYEGPQFVVDKVLLKGNQLISDAQLLQVLPLKAGDVFSLEKQKQSEKALIDLYGGLGFIETRVKLDRLYHREAARVDLAVTIDEGQVSYVGQVLVAGNRDTLDPVVYREVHGLEPGRRFERAGLEVTRKILEQGPLFSEAHVTVQGDPGDLTRPVLVEVKEKATGDVGFSAGLSSEVGLIGSIQVTEKNFDITDWPRSFDELISGKAFRGAGQVFSAWVSPGLQSSNVGVSFREPRLWESDYSGSANFGYANSKLTPDYSESRLGGGLGLGHRFGDTWSIGASASAAGMDIGSVDPFAALDVQKTKGQSTLTSLGLSASRSTVDSGLFPTTGSTLDLGLSQAGAFGGDYTFTSATIGYRKFWTIDEDFLENKSVLSVKTRLGYIFAGDAPVFERFTTGGQSSLRGFRSHGVGPHQVNPFGIVTNDTVGGDWMFLLGAEYNAPIYQDIVRYVAFIDTGTVTSHPGFDHYRVAVGAGLRIEIPFLGQAPFALDFAYPILKDRRDPVRIVSFSIDIPIQ